MRPARGPHLWSWTNGSSGLPLDIRHRFRNRFVGAFAVTTLVVASMAWFPATVAARTCGTLTINNGTVNPGSGTTSTQFTFTVKVADTSGAAPQWVRVNVNGTSTALTATGSNFVSGVTFSLKRTLP